MPHKARTLRRYYDEVWEQGDLTAIARILAPDARTRGIMGDVPFNQVELAELVDVVRGLLDDIEVSMPITVEQDDWLSALVEIRGKAADTGHDVHLSSQVIARFAGEQMVEVYSGVDSLQLFEQLDLLPENAMAIMLGGTRLG